MSIKCGLVVIEYVFYSYSVVYFLNFCMYVQDNILLHCAFFVIVIFCNLSLIFEKKMKVKALEFSFKWKRFFKKMSDYIMTMINHYVIHPTGRYATDTPDKFFDML